MLTAACNSPEMCQSASIMEFIYRLACIYTIVFY